MKPADRKGEPPPRTPEIPTEDDITDGPPEAGAYDAVEQASVDSFPASDPPAFTPTHAGKPARTPRD